MRVASRNSSRPTSSGIGAADNTHTTQHTPGKLHGCEEEDDLPDAIQEIDFGGAEGVDGSARTLCYSSMPWAPGDTHTHLITVDERRAGTHTRTITQVLDPKYSTVDALYGVFASAMPDADKAKLKAIAESTIKQLTAV